MFGKATMADKESNGVEVVKTPEKEQNGKAKAKPKRKSPRISSKKEKEGVEDCVVESPKKKTVIVIDLTDDSEDPPQISNDKKVAIAFPPQPVILSAIQLTDLNERAIESMLELSESSVAAFYGKRGREKKGILQLTMESDKDQNKALATLKKVKVSDKRELSATDTGISQSMISKLTEDVPDEDKELTSVFINNIPPEARPGILKLMFPTAGNIQFPQDNDGNSQGYAVLEVTGRKAAEEIIKHHKLYIPKIGLKILKLHMVGESSVPEPDAEKSPSNDKTEAPDQKDKEKVASSKTKQDSAKKMTLNKKSESKTSSVKGDKSKSAERKSDDRSRSRSINTSVSSQRRRDRSRSRGRRNSRDRSRRSGSSGRRDSRRELNRSTGSRDAPSTRTMPREATGEIIPGSAVKQSRWEQRQRTQSQTNDQVNPRASSVTGLNEPHELIMPGNVGPASRRGGMPGLNNRDNLGQTVTRQGAGNPISQQRNPLGGNYQTIARSIISSIAVERAQGNPTRDIPSPWIGPGRQGNQGRGIPRAGQGNQGQGIPRAGQGNVLSSQGNRMAGQSTLANPIIGRGNQMVNQGNQNLAVMQQKSQPMGQRHSSTGPGYQMMGQNSQMNIHGTSALAQMNPMYGQSTQIQQQRSQMTGQGSRLMGQVNQMTPPIIPAALLAQRNQIMGQSNPMMGQSNQMMGQSNPVMGQSNQMMGQSNQMMGQSNPMMGQSNPMMGQSNQMMGQSNPMMGQSNQMMGQSNPMMGQSNPMMGQSNPMMGQSNPMMGQSNPMMGQSNQMMGQSNQMMQQSNPMMGQSNPMMGQSNQMMGQSNQMMGQSNQMMDQRNPMMGQTNQMMGQRNQMMGQIQGNQMIVQGSGVMGQGDQMRQGLSNVSQVVQPRSMTGSTLESSMAATLGILQDVTTTPALGRNAGVTPGQLNMDTGVRDTRQNEMSQLNRGIAEQATTRRSQVDDRRLSSQVDDRRLSSQVDDRRLSSQVDDRRLSSQDVQRSSITSDNLRQSSPNKSSRSATRRDDIHPDSRARLSDRAETKDTKRSSRFDRSRSRSPVRESRRPSRFDDRGSGSRGRNPNVHKSDDDDRRRRSTREPQQQTLRGGPDVQTAPDLSSIRSKLMNTLRQLETGNLSDTTELADIAEKIKQVQQQQQQKVTNPQEMRASARSGDLQRAEPQSMGNQDRYSVGKGGSYESRRDDRNEDRYARRDDSRRSPSRQGRPDRESSGNRSGDITSKVAIDYGHQSGSRSRFRDEQVQQLPDSRIQQDYLSGLQAGRSDNYGSRNLGSSEFGNRSTNQQGIMSDSNRAIQRQGFAIGDEQNRRQTQQLDGMNQREATQVSSWDMQRQGYTTDMRTSDRDSFTNFPSQSVGAGDTMGSQGFAQTSAGQNQQEFRNPPPWQKSSNNPPTQISTDIKPAGPIAPIPGRSKKVYVGNLPPSAKWDEVATFFNIEMWKRRMTSPSSLNKPVAGVVQAPDRSYAYVMFNTADEAEAAVLLDGIRYQNCLLSIKSSMFNPR